jgi:hypothetical protein
MANRDEAIAEVSWSICRNWVYNEPDILELIFKHAHLKSALMAIASMAMTHLMTSIQLLLLFYGYTTNPDTGELTKVDPKKKRIKVQGLMLDFLRQSKVDVAVLHEAAISPATRAAFSHLYDREMKVLDHVWHKRGTIRKASGY